MQSPFSTIVGESFHARVVTILSWRKGLPTKESTRNLPAFPGAPESAEGRRNLYANGIESLTLTQYLVNGMKEP